MNLLEYALLKGGFTRQKLGLPPDDLVALPEPAAPAPAVRISAGGRLSVRQRFGSSDPLYRMCFESDRVRRPRPTRPTAAEIAAARSRAAEARLISQAERYAAARRGAA